MRPAGIGLAVIAAAAALALAGCGGNSGSEEPSARDVALQYVDAYNSGDFDRVCELFSNSYKQQLKAGSNCPGFLKEQTSGAATKLRLVDVEEKGTQALAHVRSQPEDASGKPRDESVGLIRQQDGSWRVVAVTGSSEAD